MRILLIHQNDPSVPYTFDWSSLVSLLSTKHDVRIAWWVVEKIEPGKIAPEVLPGIMLATDVQDFAPDIVLIDGQPDAQAPKTRSRKLPWQLEQELQQRGCAVVFIRAIPDTNRNEGFGGFAEYGFPLCFSRDSRPVRLCGPNNDQYIKIQDWDVPEELQSAAFERIRVVDEIVIHSPWILDNRMLNGTEWNSRGESLIYAPYDYDGKDPVWIYDDEIGGVQKPFVVAGWSYYPGLVFLFTGDAFSDRMIGRGSNALLFQMLVEAIATLQRKRLMLNSARTKVDPSIGLPIAAQMNPSKLFLSHSSRDKRFVRRLAKDLVSRGISVWVDEAEIKVGDSLIEKIREGIDQVDYVAVILSRASIRSEWVKREVDIAMNQEIARRRVKVLPILIESLPLDAMPSFLVGKLYADFSTEEGYRDALQKLLERLRKDNSV